MWDKDISKPNKNEDTPGEGITEMSNSSCSKSNNLVENTSAKPDKVVVATYVFNEDDECADNKSEESRQKKDIDHLLSIVDDASAGLTKSSEQTNILQNVQKSVETDPVQASKASVSTAPNTFKTAELSVTIDCNELPYKNVYTNLHIQTSKPSSKPAISVKHFSPILPNQTLQNETVSVSNNTTETDKQSKDLISDNVAGPQSNTCSLSVEQRVHVARVRSPTGSVEDLPSVSEIRACSPTPSSVTTASTFRTARSASGRRVECSRHIRRPPKEPEEYVEALFPHIQRAHNQIRQALLHAPHTDVKDNALLKRKMLEIIQLYSNGCKSEFERAVTSLVLCRRLKRNIMRLLDLFHDICLSCREDQAYLYYISQIIGVYNSLEIRLSFSMTRLQKCALIHRIVHVINKHLIVKDESLAKENILRMFLHMPDLYSARFIMEPIFNTFLQEIPTSSNTWCQKELPDKTFVQYIIILHLWKEMLRDPLEQVELINRAQHFMCPTKTLHANPMYTNHLPTIHTRKHAVKDILNSLKFFHDLRNAAICDDTLHDGDDTIEVVIDEVINTPFWDFGATYQSETKDQRHIKSRVSAIESADCVDLTIEDDEEYDTESPDNYLTWLIELKEKAAERVNHDESEKVICLDSDSEGELFSGSILDPAESYQDCDAFDTDYTSLDSSASDDRVPSDEEILQSTAITNNGLRTYLTPKSKTQVTSYEDKRTATCQRSYERSRDGDGEGDRTTVGGKSTTTSTFTETGLPLILNSFTVRGKQNLHLLKSPRYSLEIGPERFGYESLDDTCNEGRGTSRNVMQKHDRAKSSKTYFNRNTDVHGGRGSSRGGIASHEKDLNAEADTDEDDEDDYHSLPLTASSSATTLGKVIYSQALSPSKHRFSSANANAEHEKRYKYLDKKNMDSRKHLQAEDKPTKKQVKFNDNPIGPTRRPHTKLPIKPAIHLSKIQPSNQPRVFSNSPQPRFASPSSSTSSTTESLKQMAQKEHINAIATLFSSYKINKPAPISGAPVGPSGSNTTLENKPKNKAGPKSMHISRKANTTSGPRRLGTNSPQSVANSLSPMRNQSSSPVTTERTNSPVTIAPEIAADQKLSKKCVVILQENEEVIKYKRQEVAFINSLLEKQREMQRERALKRQEFQNILKQKRDEGKRLMAEIAEIKRQQAEANEAQQVQKRSHPMLQQQSSTLLNRKRLLVKERNVKFNTKPKVRSRSTTPNRNPNESEDEVDRAENEAEINGIDATQGVIGVAFDLVANNKTPIEAATEEVSAVEKDTKITETQNKKLNSAKRLYAEASNTKISSLKVQNQSTKASSQDVQTNTEMHNELAITTTHTLIKAQTTSVKDVTFMPEEISTTNNTILTGKPKLNAPSTLPIRIEHTRYARSMTPMKSVEAPTAAPSVQTVENDLPSKANFSFSSPLTSRPRLARAPSLSPSIFSRRNRVKVRRSMQDPSSNTDFPTNAVSWLSNASTRTKAVKVRLKRLQHFNINATPPSSPEKVHTDKAPKSMRPASAMPAFFEVHETNATSTEVPTHTENPLEAVANKNERVQSFKGKGEEKLLEMDEKYGVNVTKTVENVLLVAPNQVSPPRPSLKTVQTRVNKGVRRKPQRKIQQGSKKLKLTEKLDNLDNNSATLTNTDESAEKVQCASKKETKEKVVDSAIAGCAKTSQDMGNPSEAEGTNVQQPEENGEKQQEIVLEVQNEMHTPMDVVVVSVCEESIAKGPMENASMEIDCTDSKTKRNPTHGAVVTQVVDVTPGRHIKKRVLGDLLLATNTPKSTQFVSNEVFNTELNLTCTEKSSADLELPEKVIEACTPPINSDTLSIVNPNSTIPPPPIDTGCQVINEDTTNVNKFELQNVNDDTPPPTSLALPKASKPVSSESILCNMQFDVDPTTAIGLQNNMHENNEITPNESGKTTENAMPTTAADQNVLDSLPNAGARCLTEDEESSSDCLLSQLSERVQKMTELESIVDATTVHVIKEATMTLMSFEVAPTLPAYLLNGESRDVPTPPAISTRAPTPTGKNDAAAEIEPIEPTATSKPVLIESLVKEMPQTSQTADAKVLTQKSLPKPKNDSTNAIVPLQEAEIVTDNTIPLVAPEVQVKFDERLSSNHLSPPLSQEQQIAEIINSPTPASAISTSDHEVSSTQEIVYASSKRSNANAVNKSVDLPFSASIEEEAAMVVQNSQIDTTHHLPENSYYMRKRSRKFSDEFTMCENRIENVNNKDALRQRRKTFSSESCLSAAQFVTNNAIFPIHANTITVGSATAASTSTNLSSVGGNSGGSSPSTTTEPVIKPPPARRRNHTHTKRNNSQSPLSARSRMAAGGAGELNGSFVYNCSHLQSPKANIADVERCVVLPASAVVPPVNLGNISRTYSKNNMAQIKVFVPPDAEMCLQNEDGEKDSYVATTTSKRGRPVSAVNRNRNKKPNIPNTAPNKSKGKTPVSGSKKRNTVNNAQKPENTKSSKATAVAKAPTTRAKNVERTSNKKRK